jgi:hypothetical protein
MGTIYTLFLLCVLFSGFFFDIFKISIFHLFQWPFGWFGGIDLALNQGKKAVFRVFPLQVLKAGDARRINRDCSKKLGTFCKVVCRKIGKI